MMGRVGWDSLLPQVASIVEEIMEKEDAEGFKRAARNSLADEAKTFFDNIPKLNGVRHMTPEMIIDALHQGASVVRFKYCVSVVFRSYLIESNMTLVNNFVDAMIKSFLYNMISLIVGWWCFPPGHFFVVWAIGINCYGGKKISENVTVLLEQEITMNGGKNVETLIKRSQ